MISIRNTLLSELSEIANIGNQNHVNNFLSKKSLSVHENDFVKNNIIYLSIISKSKSLAGYIILRSQKQVNSIQLKRILIDEKHLGIGQQAIIAVEQYCLKELNCNHIWLDVYKNNKKAIYIYKKLGYQEFKESTHHSKMVSFYEKTL